MTEYGLVKCWISAINALLWQRYQLSYIAPGAHDSSPPSCSHLAAEPADTFQIHLSSSWRISQNKTFSDCQNQEDSYPSASVKSQLKFLRNISAWIREGLQGTDRESLPCEANRNILNPSAMYCSSKTCIKGERKGRRNKSSGVHLIVMDSKQWSITATWNSFLFWLHWLKGWNPILSHSLAYRSDHLIFANMKLLETLGYIYPYI